MGHGHDHGTPNEAHRGRLVVVLVMSATYMVLEIVGGLATNSLALIADAGHMASDVAALALTLFALWIAKRPPGGSRTYGYYRTEILAALANGATLVAIALYVLVEAYQRIGAPPAVMGGGMTLIAMGGLAMNLFGLWLLNAGKEASLNVRGAWLHVLTDALGSVGAIAAGLLIWAFGWNWADPVISALISVLVAYSAWALLRDAVGVLMEAAPADVDLDAVRDLLAGLPGAIEVYDLHVWTITSGLVSLSAHVALDRPDPDGALLQRASDDLHARFGIGHTTLQLEPPGFRRGERPV